MTSNNSSETVSEYRTLAKELEEHYIEDSERSRETKVNPFPPYLYKSLIISVLIGVMLGWLSGYLIFNNVLTIPGAEEMYSMTPLTFYVFWIMLGIAAGVFLIGTSTLLIYKVKD